MHRRQFLAAAAAAAAVGAGRAFGAEDWRVNTIPLKLEKPSALCAAPDGSIYAAGETTILKLDVNGNEVQRIAVKSRPGCLVLLNDGRLLVGMRRCIEVFENGACAAVWQDLGGRAWLTSLAADEENVFAADAGNRAVWRFDTAGKLIHKFGEFVVPSPYFDVAINPIGELWVANPGKHGLENYRPDGELISSWYRFGMGPEAFSGCCNPAHFAFRSDSAFVTYEKGIDRIKIVGPDTALIGVVSAGSQEHSLLKAKTEPPVSDLAVDARDRILVLNKHERAILIYEPPGAREGAA